MWYRRQVYHSNPRGTFPLTPPITAATTKAPSATGFNPPSANAASPVSSVPASRVVAAAVSAAPVSAAAVSAA
eukprot:5772025-Prymnesium_polylepis.1